MQISNFTLRQLARVKNEPIPGSAAIVYFRFSCNQMTTVVVLMYNRVEKITTSAHDADETDVPILFQQ
jgi:hypothetical protein